MGAPKAAATPAAAPHEAKSRLSLRINNIVSSHNRLRLLAHNIILVKTNLSDLKNLYGNLNLSSMLLNCENPTPIIVPLCIIGPSLPTNKPKKEKVREVVEPCMIIAIS